MKASVAIAIRISASLLAVSTMQTMVATQVSAAAKAPKVISVTPGNGDRSDTPVSSVSITFSGPVKLESLRVSGPYGDNSKEQILVADGDTVPLAAAFTYALKTPASEIGRYEVDLMAWHAKSKTSHFQSFSFKVGTAEQIEAYELEIEEKAKIAELEAGQPLSTAEETTTDADADAMAEPKS